METWGDDHRVPSERPSEIAAGIYKQLGYGPKGYDGNDNNGDDQIDDIYEGEMGLSADEIATINARLLKHTAQDRPQ